MPSRKQHIEAIVGNMYAIKRAMMARSFARGAKVPAITPSQWGVLVIVMKREAVAVKDIARELGITSSAATQLIDELVNKKFLTRQGDTRDHRALSLVLSDKYKKRMGNMRAKSMERFTAMFDALTEKELAQYAALNKKVADNILNKK